MEEVECKVILIPSYEPDNKLIDLVKEIKYDIVVVNDGSSKEYNSIFKEVEKYAKVISYDTNMGKGYALKTGIEYIKNKYEKNYIIVTMDSDGQHSPNDIDKLVSNVSDNVLVLGKRLRGDDTPLRSYLGNSITRFIYKLVTKKDIYDTQTGFRAFNDSLVDYMLSIPKNRFEYEMNVLLYSNDIKIKEVEVETIYIDNNKNSHFNAFKDSFKIYKQIFKFASISIISFFIDYLLYILFNLKFNITISNIFARIISGTFNYIGNKNIVFNNKNKLYKSVYKYILLAFLIIILNTSILNLFVCLNINKYIAKIITEILLFIFNYFIQKKFIFKEDDKK